MNMWRVKTVVLETISDLAEVIEREEREDILLNFHSIIYTHITPERIVCHLLFWKVPPVC